MSTGELRATAAVFRSLEFLCLRDSIVPTGSNICWLENQSERLQQDFSEVPPQAVWKHSDKGGWSLCLLTGCCSVLTVSGVSSAADWWQSGWISANRETPSTQTDTHRLLLGDPRRPSLCVWRHKEFLSVCLCLFEDVSQLQFVPHCFSILTLCQSRQKSNAHLIHQRYRITTMENFDLKGLSVLLQLFPLKSFFLNN